MRKLSIIILQHNTPKDVENCLLSLQTSALPPDTDIVVINNGGKQANQKITPSSYSGLHVQFYETPNDGFPKGNNEGLKYTEAEYVAFLNPDIILEGNTISTLLAYLEKNQTVGIVGPQLHYPNGSIQDNYRVFPRLLDLIIKRTDFLRRMFSNRMRTYLMWDKDPNRNEAVDWITGAFIIVTKKCLQDIGNHDERYFLFMSDVAICREAWNKGYEVYFIGQCKALHNDERLSRGGMRDLFRKKILRIHVQDAIRYYLHYLFQKLPKNCPSSLPKNLPPRKSIF